MNDSCRVLRVITRLNIGGPARQALLLTHALADVYPTLLVAGRPDAAEGELTDARVEVRRVPLVRPVRPASDARAMAGVRRLLSQHHPQLVHTHMAKAGTIGRIAALSLGRRRPRLVHTFHGHVLEGYFPTAIQRSFIEVERRLARRTDVLIAVSPQVRDDLLALGIGTADKFRVIPLGLELGDFGTDRQGGLLRARLGIGENTPLIGAVGRLVPIKDIGTLLSAVALLPGVHVALIGDGEARHNLEHQAERLGLSGRAHFVGWYSDVAEAMTDLDIVALTSLNEGTPVAIIEALAAGKPVVATDVGGVGFVVTDGVTGRLAPKGDPAAIAASLRQSLDDPVGARAMAEAGRVEVMARFSGDRLVSDITALYDELTQA